MVNIIKLEKGSLIPYYREGSSVEGPTSFNPGPQLLWLESAVTKLYLIIFAIALASIFVCNSLLHSLFKYF